MILTPDQRLRVFVSSTLQELAAERAAARDAIAGLQLTPVLFELGARPHPPQELYRAYLEQSHLFVGIYGESYGWVAPGEFVSGPIRSAVYYNLCAQRERRERADVQAIRRRAGGSTPDRCHARPRRRRRRRPGMPGDRLAACCRGQGKL